MFSIVLNKNVPTIAAAVIILFVFMIHPGLSAPSSGMFQSERIQEEKREKIYQKMESEYTELFDAGLVSESPDKIHGENEWETAQDKNKKKKFKRGVGGAGYFPSLSVFGQTGYILFPPLKWQCPVILLHMPDHQQ